MDLKPKRKVKRQNPFILDEAEEEDASDDKEEDDEEEKEEEDEEECENEMEELDLSFYRRKDNEDLQQENTKKPWSCHMCLSMKKECIQKE